MNTVDERLAELSSKTGKDVGALKVELEAIKKTLSDRGQKGDDLEQRAVLILNTRYARELASAASLRKFQVVILCKEQERTVSTSSGERLRVASGFAYAKPDDGGDASFCTVTFWGSSADVCKMLKMNQLYKALLRQTSGGLVWSGISTPEDTGKVVDVKKLIGMLKMPAWSEISGLVDDNNIYGFRGIVSRVGRGKKKKGDGEWGVVNLVLGDMSLDEAVNMGGGLACWVQPDHLTFGEESEVVVVGKVGRSSGKEERIVVFGSGVFPIFVSDKKPPEGIPAALAGKDVKSEVEKDEEFFS